MESLYGMDLIDNLFRINDLEFITNYLNLEEKLDGNFLNQEVSDIMTQLSGRNLELDDSISPELYSVKDIIISYIRDMVCQKTQEIYDLYEVRFNDNDTEYTVGVTGSPSVEKLFTIIKIGSHPRLKIGDVIVAEESLIRCSDDSKIPIDIIEIKDYFSS
jgi:hypothetical protein